MFFLLQDGKNPARAVRTVHKEAPTGFVLASFLVGASRRLETEGRREIFRLRASQQLPARRIDHASPSATPPLLSRHRQWKSARVVGCLFSPLPPPPPPHTPFHVPPLFLVLDCALDRIVGIYAGHLRVGASDGQHGRPHQARGSLAPRREVLPQHPAVRREKGVLGEGEERLGGPADGSGGGNQGRAPRPVRG